MDLLRISATAHGINYLPEYYAASTGAFARRGIEVVATACDPWDGVLDDLAAGEADVVLGGIWGSAMHVGTGRDLVAIGQLNARFPMVIVTREPVAGFTWDWLEGRTILAPGQGGTAPYEFTAGVMREHGADPAAARFVRDLSAGMLRELFVHGLGDAMIADPLTATSLQLDGVGHPACMLADAAGPMPNSVYYTERARLGDLHDRLVALMGGIDEAMRELCSGADPAAVIAAHWPLGPQEALRRTAATLASDGTWSGVRIEPGALARWTGILDERGLLITRAGYDQLVAASVVDALEQAAR